MYSYQDRIGNNTGCVEITAFNRKDAENQFYKINRRLVLRVNKQGNPVFNPLGGFVCESVLTYNEWVKEGKPTSL